MEGKATIWPKLALRHLAGEGGSRIGIRVGDISCNHINARQLRLAIEAIDLSGDRAVRIWPTWSRV